MIFAPIQRTGSFETLSYEDLWKRGARAICASTSAEHAYGSPEYEEWDKAVGESLAAVDGGLKQGSLLAYVFVEKERQFYRVPPAHWRDGSFVEGEPMDTLFCFGMSQVPAKFHDLPLLFFVDEVEEWERKSTLHQVADAVDMSGRVDEHSKLDDLIGQNLDLREGYWSPFATLAWIVSRQAQFVAAVQHYEVLFNANRGALHSSAAWTVINSRLVRSFGAGLEDAIPALLEKLQADKLPGVVALFGYSDQPRDVARREWLGGVKRSFEFHGLELLPGLHHFGFPSEAVLRVFEPKTAPPSIAQRERLPNANSALCVEGKKPAQKLSYRPKSPTLRQRRLKAWFALMEERKSGEARERPMDSLYPEFVAWNAARNREPNCRVKSDPLKFTAFKKWVGRLRKGDA